MATVETTVEPGREYVIARPPLKMSWGAIFGGTVAALGVWLLLWSLGLALGLSSVEPETGSMRGAGLFTGIWSLVSPLIALFVGGMVAARGAGVISRSGAAIHGLVMWGLTAILGAWLLMSLLGTLVGGLASAGKTAIGAAGQAAAGAADEAPIQGQVQPEEMRREAEEMAGQVQQRFGEVKEQAQAGALQAADTTGKVFWGVFGSLFLGLASAILGAFSGVSKRQRLHAGEAPVARTTTTRSEVFP